MLLPLCRIGTYFLLFCCTMVAGRTHTIHGLTIVSLLFLSAIPLRLHLSELPCRQIPGHVRTAAQRCVCVCVCVRVIAYDVVCVLLFCALVLLPTKANLVVASRVCVETVSVNLPRRYMFR